MPTAVEYKPADESNPGPTQDPSAQPGPSQDFTGGVKLNGKTPGPPQTKPVGGGLFLGGVFVAIIAVLIIIVCFGPRGLVLGMFKPMMTGQEWQTFTCPSLVAPPEPDSNAIGDPNIQPPPEGDKVGLGGPDTIPSSGDTQPPEPDSNAIGDPGIQPPPEGDAVGLGGPDTMPAIGDPNTVPSSGEVNPPDPSDSAIGDPNLQPPPYLDTVGLGGPDTIPPPDPDLPHTMAFKMAIWLSDLRIAIGGSSMALPDLSCEDDDASPWTVPGPPPTADVPIIPTVPGPEKATATPSQAQPPACTPNPNDGVCSPCENTDLDLNACMCNNNGVCDPGEGFNCGDCMPTSAGGDGRRNTPCPAGAVCP